MPIVDLIAGRYFCQLFAHVHTAIFTKEVVENVEGEVYIVSEERSEGGARMMIKDGVATIFPTQLNSILMLPEDCSHLFQGRSHDQSTLFNNRTFIVKGLQHVQFNRVKVMNYMFFGNDYRAIRLSVNLRNVQSARFAFADNPKLNLLDLSACSCLQLRDLTGFCYGDVELRTLKMPEMHFGRIKDMRYAFAHTKNLTHIEGLKQMKLDLKVATDGWNYNSPVDLQIVKS